MDDSKKTTEMIDESKRRFLVTGTYMIGGIGALCALRPFIASWWPSEAVIASGAPVEIDLSQLEPGQQATVPWQGKPVWIIRRTLEMLKQLDLNHIYLRDPSSLVQQQPPYAQNKYRSIQPEYLVLIGICTHLGCIPQYTPISNTLGEHWPGGFYCPCHGSTFDLAGRVFKGVPAPINLAVPPYYFLSEHVIVIGENKQD